MPMYINMNGDVVTQIMGCEAMNTVDHLNTQKIVQSFAYGLEFRWSN